MKNNTKTRLPKKLAALFSTIEDLPAIFTEPADKLAYNKGYRYGQGDAGIILRPKTSGHVSEIMKICHANNIKIVAQGGNTSLVGASTSDEVVLSTTLLNKDIFELNQKEQTIKIGAGWVLGALNEKLQPSGLWLPIDIGSSGTCNIGGIVATNAAGTRASRYGNAKMRTSELEVVLADGAIKTFKTDLSKNDTELPQDNSKIDFNNPMIGSEGWLGIITQADMKLEPVPVKMDTAVLVPKDNTAIVVIRDRFEKEFSDKFTAFEIMSADALRLVAKHIPNTKYLFAADVEQISGRAMVLLVEVSSIIEGDDIDEEMIGVMESLINDGFVITGLYGDSHLYWHHRHHISEAISKEGVVIATDIAVRGADNLSPFIDEATRALHEKYPHVVIIPFGHAMLGAVHFNVIWPKDIALTIDDKISVQEIIYDIAVEKYHGTFSAEHGIGSHNQWAYDKYTNNKIKKIANQVKLQYDPKGILQPNINFGREN